METKPFNSRDFLIPGSILLGGVIIAGAILSTKSPSPAELAQTAVQRREEPQVSLTVTAQDHIRGNPKAAVTIMEFSDLECPFCKSFHPTLQRVLQEYGDKVRWVYKHFPLDTIHPKADKEAEAAECAGELGGEEAFWAYVDRVFEITPSNNGLDLQLLPRIGEDIGVDGKALADCLASGKYAQKVEDQYQEGIRAGVTGTPGSFVNGVPVRGAVQFELLKQIIDRELAK